jgi:glucan phosphoethanolaminetransferase (alkaline phosphatase superfamily)
MKKSDAYGSAKTIIALLIVLVAFAVFLLFYYNTDAILQSNKFLPYMTLATVGMGLLLVLLYLVNNPQDAPKSVTHHKSTTSKSKSKKKKK